jgi:hypothetical protein
MSSFALVIDPGSLRCYSNGSVSGVVYANAGDVSFPEKNWTDLVVSVVIEWLNTVAKLESGASRRERFHFLDGPFAIDLSVLENRIVAVTLIARRLAGDIVMGESRVDLDEVFKDACGLTDTLLGEFERRGWRGPNIDALCAQRRELAKSP